MLTLPRLNNIRKTSKPDHMLKDIPVIKQSMPELAEHTDDEVISYYSWFNIEYLGTGWCSFSPRCCAMFREFLAKQPDLALAEKYANIN